MVRILFFDTETTGLPRKRGITALEDASIWPELVSISWQVFDDRQFVKKENFIIKPSGFKIPSQSVSFHGITTEFAEDHGKPLYDVLTLFEKDAKSSAMIVAHNLEFDKNVVFHSFKWRLFRPVDWWPKVEFCSLQKSMREMKLYSPYGRPSDPYKMPKLDELYTDTFGMPAPLRAHSSDRDVDVLQQIVWARWPYFADTL
jgi:DNA polymerase III epsilon subunit-like protein